MTSYQQTIAQTLRQAIFGGQAPWTPPAQTTSIPAGKSPRFSVGHVGIDELPAFTRRRRKALHGRRCNVRRQQIERRH